MEEMIKAAKTRLLKMEQEIETLKKFLESAEAAAAILGDEPGADSNSKLPATTHRKESDGTVEPTKRTRVSDNPKAEVLIPVVKDVLRANGKPMTRRQLHEALSRRGFVVRGTDPVKTLGTILWRAKDQIKSVEGWGYWPIEDDFDPVMADLLG